MTNGALALFSVAATSLSDRVLMFRGSHCFFRTTSDPAEARPMPVGECLAERNELSPTIQCSRHRAVCENNAEPSAR